MVQIIETYVVNCNLHWNAKNRVGRTGRGAYGTPSDPNRSIKGKGQERRKKRRRGREWNGRGGKGLGGARREGEVNSVSIRAWKRTSIRQNFDEENALVCCRCFNLALLFLASSFSSVLQNRALTSTVQPQELKALFLQYQTL